MFRNNRILRSLYKQFVSCTSCDTKITTSGQCNICQVKPFSKQNYFELLQQKTTYSLDIRQLRNKFLMEQAKWHPDLFTNKTPLERQESDLKSTKLNKAYEVIKDPLSRAHYLLKLRGKEVTEQTQLNDSEFLMNVMEIQEEITECDEDELGRLLLENKERMNHSIARIGTLFDIGDLDECQKEAIRLNYWYTIQRLIDDRL